MTHALIVDGYVANLIILADPADFSLPAGASLVLVEAAEVAIGWRYDGQTFSPIDGPAVVPEPARVTKVRFGELFTDDEHKAMNLIRWQTSQMDAAERAIPANPLVYAETLFIKFGLPAEFIELDLPMVADGLGLLGMLGVFGDASETRIPEILADFLPVSNGV